MRRTPPQSASLTAPPHAGEHLRPQILPCAAGEVDRRAASRRRGRAPRRPTLGTDRLASLLLTALLLLCATAALAAPQFPPLTGRVVDNAHILSPQAAQKLDADLAGLEAQTGHQVVVATI